MKTFIQVCSVILLYIGCGAGDDIIEYQPKKNEVSDTTGNPTSPTGNNSNKDNTYTYLALGDSYTIGQSVCDTCNFPIQLKQVFQAKTEAQLQTRIIARTGWRTDNLMEAINQEKPDANNDLVTLLIGVNNQFQGKELNDYKIGFQQLLNKAIQLAKGDANRVIVLSIPDYAYTPFGQSTANPHLISEEIDLYNEVAKTITEDAGIEFLNITDITRRGLQDPELVAQDGLHPSTKAYALFVERMLPFVYEILK